jgi:hypothetical protein
MATGALHARPTPFRTRTAPPSRVQGTLWCLPAGRHTAVSRLGLVMGSLAVMAAGGILAAMVAGCLAHVLAVWRLYVRQSRGNGGGQSGACMGSLAAMLAGSTTRVRPNLPRQPCRRPRADGERLPESANPRGRRTRPHISNLRPHHTWLRLRPWPMLRPGRCVQADWLLLLQPDRPSSQP